MIVRYKQHFRNTLFKSPNVEDFYETGEALSTITGHPTSVTGGKMTVLLRTLSIITALHFFQPDELTFRRIVANDGTFLLTIEAFDGCVGIKDPRPERQCRLGGIVQLTVKPGYTCVFVQCLQCPPFCVFTYHLLHSQKSGIDRV